MKNFTCILDSNKYCYLTYIFLRFRKKVILNMSDNFMRKINTLKKLNHVYEYVLVLSALKIKLST